MLKKYLVTHTVTYYLHAEEQEVAERLARFDADEFELHLPLSMRPVVESTVEEL